MISLVQDEITRRGLAAAMQLLGDGEHKAALEKYSIVFHKTTDDSEVGDRCIRFVTDMVLRLEATEGT